MCELKALVAKRRAEREAILAYNARPLEQKMQDWFAALAPHEIQPCYTMWELTAIFGVAAGRVGVALHSLGWQRRRRWGKGAFVRYWVPPSTRTL